jgi:hypothetical protein
MSDTVDLRTLLAGWPYDPDNDLRVGHRADGGGFLQVRTPLGIEQFELDGRPDGQRPHGMDSALDFHLNRLARAQAAKQESDFVLDPDACAELFSEGTLYYFRYYRLFQLRDWPRTIRDTARNLRLFDLVHRHAAREEDRNHLEKWRPYIVRMNAAASALAELEAGNHERALRLAEEAIEDIEALDELEDETFQFERERSREALRELTRQIKKVKPVSKLELLQRQLSRAVETQEFERAAELRYRIRELRGKGAGG